MRWGTYGTWLHKVSDPNSFYSDPKKNNFFVIFPIFWWFLIKNYNEFEADLLHVIVPCQMQPPYIFGYFFGDVGKSVFKMKTSIHVIWTLYIDSCQVCGSQFVSLWNVVCGGLCMHKTLEYKHSLKIFLRFNSYWDWKMYEKRWIYDHY